MATVRVLNETHPSVDLDPHQSTVIDTRDESNYDRSIVNEGTQEVSINGSGIKTYIFRNQNYLNSGSSLNAKLAGEFLFYDVSDSATLSDKSTDEDLSITNGVIGFQENKIYDIKVKMKLEPEVSSNHLELALAQDTSTIFDSSTINTSKLVDARYVAEFDGFVYTADKGDVKLCVSNCVQGASALNEH